MSRIKLSGNYAEQWNRYSLSCKTVARKYAGLSENASDPFTYSRVLKDLMFGYEDLFKLSSIVEARLKHSPSNERDSINARIGIITATHNLA